MAKKPKVRDRILEAAMACVEEIGVQKTTIDDVAERANLSRITIYRTFESRQNLIEELALVRLKSMAEKLTPIVESYSNFEEAVVEGSIESVEISRKDETYMALMAATGLTMEQILIQPDSPVQALFDQIWANTFKKARKEGLLRSDQSLRAISNWLRSIHIILYLRSDLNLRGERKLLKDFFLPSIMAQ